MESARLEKGRGESRVQRGKKKIRAVKNQAQKGCEREEARSRNTRQKELFRLEEVSKILGHRRAGEEGKVCACSGKREERSLSARAQARSLSGHWGVEGRRNLGNGAEQLERPRKRTGVLTEKANQKHRCAVAKRWFFFKLPYKSK